MSLEAPTGVYVALGGATLLAAVGLMLVIGFVDRWWRGRGRIRCMAWDWALTYREDGPRGPEAACSFEAHLLNAGRSPSALHRPSVVLRGGRREVAGRLMDADTGENLRVIDLPPGRGARVRLAALFEGEEAREVSGLRGAHYYLVGRFPSGRRFERKIAGRGDFVGGRKRLGTSRRDFVAGRKPLGLVRRHFVAGRKKIGASRKNYRARRR